MGGWMMDGWKKGWMGGHTFMYTHIHCYDFAENYPAAQERQ
jgi:hypothetical protein